MLFSLSSCMSIRLSISACPSVCSKSVHMSAYLCLPVSVYPSVYLSVCPSASVCVGLLAESTHVFLGTSLRLVCSLFPKLWSDGSVGVFTLFLPFQFFVYSSGAQYILTDGEASSVPGRALASGVGLMLAVYCGFNASGTDWSVHMSTLMVVRMMMMMWWW